MKSTFSLSLALALTASLLSAEEVPEGEKLFALKVKPLFAEKCLACHGDEPDKIKGDFDMRSRESVLRGGEYFGEEVLVPGKGETSYLYLTTTRTEEDYEMPPKEADQLAEEQQWWIRDWINAGAPWVSDERVARIQEQHAEGEQVATSLALSEDWQKRRYVTEKLWAYRPLQVEAVPEGTHPVDWFIGKKLKAAELNSAPDADAEQLVRRMSFGFTGLPPEPEEVEEFAAEYQKDPEMAVRDFAIELMASPHYGEQFGLHWMDVARYADSAGFANDYSRPNAWRYRDYVVRAFNEDKPYDQFVREQVAGDEIDDSDPELLIATGFLRMGPWEQTSMSVFKETRQQWLDDVTDSVGQAFLGHALQCAKCHDHKFDPVPTRDYYRMMAVFSTTQFAERDAPFLEVENRKGFERSDEWVKAKIAAYAQQQKALDEKVAQARKDEKERAAKVGDNGLDPGDEASLARMKKNMSRHKWELERTQPIAFGVYTGKTIQRNNVGSRIPLPDAPWGKGVLEPDTILAGGSAYSPSDPVEPGALSAAESLGEMEPVAFPNGQGKRRMALSEWIVNPKNPLTARVMVNRVWSWHFGRGLAGNPNNLGGTGALPTHPQLLDYLANWFMENGWSIKKLNELIVTSKTYRRSSVHPDPALQVKRDPKLELYASFLPRRLTAEELRDAMLAATGELNREIGGIPARPDMDLEVAFQPRQIMGGTASVYEPDPLPEQRNRRSLYAEKIRGLRDPFFESFNQPGPDKSCELRETSTVTPQALTLFNAEEVYDRALGFAVRLLREQPEKEATIDRAFELALGRTPSESERAVCLEHWNDAISEEEGKPYQERRFPNKISRTVMAEKTGEPYTFEEILPAYNGYQPDIQPADVDARTRGLAQLCLALFNLNEFAYLD
ncbi:MAG: PSD1 domain-containing protein [Verrucomicrobiae bacterium]|nr:PSD1 domain-containing protein [Verrucomicrobiae bacterium]